jgi:hypothetical protein
MLKMASVSSQISYFISCKIFKSLLPPLTQLQLECAQKLIQIFRNLENLCDIFLINDSKAQSLDH